MIRTWKNFRRSDQKNGQVVEEFPKWGSEKSWSSQVKCSDWKIDQVSKTIVTWNFRRSAIEKTTKSPK